MLQITINFKLNIFMRVRVLKSPELCLPFRWNVYLFYMMRKQTVFFFFNFEENKFSAAG